MAIILAVHPREWPLIIKHFRNREASAYVVERPWATFGLARCLAVSSTFHHKENRMKRLVVIIAASLTVGALGVSAQNLPYPTEAKAAYGRVKNFLLAAANKMPDENYGFKASPDVRPFGQLIAHIADSQWTICSIVKGQQKPGDAASKSSKADLVAALKASFDYCDSAYDSLNDATIAQKVMLFQREFSKLSALSLNTSHDNEMYGTISVYMRLKGLVPPSSEKH